MKNITLLVFLFILNGCQSSNVQKLEDVNTKPQWIHELSSNKKINEAVALNHKTISFDETIFKFKTLVTPPKNAVQATVPSHDSSLHVVINNGQPQTPEKVDNSPQLSRIEKTYHELMGISGGKAIKQIGYDELIADIPQLSATVTDDYIIGPGDKVNIHITGTLNLNKTYTVNPKGVIFLPERIGAIHLLGIKKKQLNNVLESAIKKEYKNIKLDANLTDLRTVRILITGNVIKPGLKTLVPGSSLIDALASVGGIHKDGSLRNITVKSKNGQTQNIDLYKLLFKGQLELDIQLYSGDQIIVPPIGATVCLLGITGQGIFEIKNERLSELFEIHSELNAFIAKDRIFLEKTVNQMKREVFSIDLDSALQMKLEDGYTLEFQSVRKEIDNTVEVIGEVSRPGKYPWTNNMRVSDLLKKAEGFLLNASLHKALIRRKLNGEAIYNKIGGLGVYRVREELIWLPLDKILAGDKSNNIQLKRFDTLRIMPITHFQDTPSVEISGSIRKEGRYNLSQNMTLGDLITLAGNPQKSAYPGYGVIVRKIYNSLAKNFDVKMYHFSVLEVIQGKKASLATLENGDQVIIRTAATQSVKVSIAGQVQFPGSYILPANSKITDLIKAAGGLLNQADLRAAEFYRQSIKKMQEERLDELFEKTRQRLTRSRSTITRDGKIRESYASTMELKSLQKLKNEMFQRQIKGRVVLNFLQKEFPDSPDNLNLEDSDRLLIPQQRKSVMVMGHVYSPNAFVWRPGTTIKDYLNMSGGYRDEAGKKDVYLVLASGQVKSARQIGHDELMKIQPGPGDSLLIPKEELERSNLAVASDYISILRQAAELGAISNAIPKADSVDIGINSDQSTREVNSGSYTPLLK